ncbi:calcium-transporting ATPase, partial [Haematococcus lacustris]
FSSPGCPGELQAKLEVVAAAVGKVGLGVAIACFIALLVKWCVENKGFPIKQINNNGPVQVLMPHPLGAASGVSC